jgi:Family of unknown function (DUF6152)
MTVKEEVKRGGTAMRVYLAVFSAVTVFLLLSLAAPTYAHHGISSWFDMSHSVSVKGIVTSFDWTNPHSYLYADVKDAKGAIEKWTAEMASPAMLKRSGWRRDSLKAGDEITLVGKTSKDGKPMMLLEKIILANGQELATGQALPAGARDGGTASKE